MAEQELNKKCWSGKIIHVHVEHVSKMLGHSNTQNSAAVVYWSALLQKPCVPCTFVKKKHEALVSSKCKF